MSYVILKFTFILSIVTMKSGRPYVVFRAKIICDNVRCLAPILDVWHNVYGVGGLNGEFGLVTTGFQIQIIRTKPSLQINLHADKINLWFWNFKKSEMEPNKNNVTSYDLDNLLESLEKIIPDPNAQIK